MTEQTSSESGIEVLRPDFPRGEFRAAMFDFDGTLSLIRRNWQAVMIPMMVDVLAETGTGESREQLHERVEEFVMRLNGKQTIYQMIQLADEVKARGGSPRRAARIQAAISRPAVGTGGTAGSRPPAGADASPAGRSLTVPPVQAPPAY